MGPRHKSFLVLLLRVLFSASNLSASSRKVLSAKLGIEMKLLHYENKII